MSPSFDWLPIAFPRLQGFQPLAVGGQKWVFRCTHPEYGTCVLKVMKPGATQYLDRELEAAARLQQLNAEGIPQIFEVGRTPSPVGEVVWILEEYVEGAVLSARLAAGPLSKRELLTLAEDLVSAAAQAESVHLVHRDIKPDNVKIDASGKAWLLDFGIVRILDLESKTPSDAPMGPHTAGYGAPEQFDYRKREIRGRSDLFAIGVVLHESATGSNPFRNGATGRFEVLQRVLYQALPRLDLPWDTHGEFSDYVAALTMKAPHQRPRSCLDALVWLREIVARLGG